jgi:hypothetical protein
MDDSRQKCIPDAGTGKHHGSQTAGQGLAGVHEADKVQAEQA